MCGGNVEHIPTEKCDVGQKLPRVITVLGYSGVQARKGS